jgi:hypothetical protein
MAKKIGTPCLPPALSTVAYYETTPQSSLDNSEDDDVPPTNVAKAEERTNDVSSATFRDDQEGERQQAAVTTNDEDDVKEEVLKRWTADYWHIYNVTSVHLRPTFVWLIHTAIHSTDDDGSMARGMERVRREFEAKEEADRQGSTKKRKESK